MNKFKFRIEGLDCINCANEIERELMRYKNIKEVNINFTTKILYIEMDDENIKDIESYILKIITNIEPLIKIVSDNTKYTKENRFFNIKNRLILSLILFIVSFMFQSIVNLKYVLLITSYIIIGIDVIYRAFNNILRGKVFDENFLLVIATFGAFSINEIPEAVAVMLFYQFGEFLQNKAVNKSRKSISKLMNIRPDVCNLKTISGIKKVKLEDVKLDDIVIVKVGEKIPLDGIIVSGDSMVDTSLITGESVPRRVKVDDQVIGGFINQTVLLEVKVKKIMEESTVSKILDLVENASAKKAYTENFITKFSRYYTPSVVIVALLLALVPPIFFNQGYYKWLYSALIFLVISCPCALVVSIPLGFFAGIGMCSKKGLLIKGSNYLEALNYLEILVVDKTGTVTKGNFVVTKVVCKNNILENDLLKYIAYAEYYSNHPIANAIKEKYNGKIDEKDISNFTEISGYGIKVNVFEKSIILGNEKMMKREDINFNKCNDIGTNIYVVISGEYVGYINVADEIKDNMKDVLDKLRKLGISKIFMLTGDIKEISENISNKLGIDKVYSELLPDQKVKYIDKINEGKSKNKKLAFIGDGMNDAPVLAIADIGIAMGGLGSDAAIEAADIVIMNDDVSKLIDGIKIAEKTKKIIWQNIIFAIVVKLLVMILGIFNIATLWEAVFADVGVSIIAIINVMRILRLGNE